MDLREVAQFVREHWLLILTINVVLGLIFGAIPLMLGRGRGQKTLGIVAFIVTLILTLPSALFGLLCCIIFTVIILVRGKNGGPAE